MEESFFKELKTVKAGNALYQNWLDYTLSLTKSDIREIVKNGMTYQADGLRSMIRELIAGQPVPKTLHRKLDLILVISRKKANELR
jgi:hypothetical protein